METRLIALKLFLEKLDVSSEIQTLDDRKRVQKAVYLGQLFGVDLGFRFGWYLMGPYSPALTRDYYELQEAIAVEDKEWEKSELVSSVQEKLEKALPLLNKPHDFNLPLEDWLELVSSYHYLLRVRGSSKDEAIATLQEEKKKLTPFVKKAEEELIKVGLL